MLFTSRRIPPSACSTKRVQEFPFRSSRTMWNSQAAQRFRQHRHFPEIAAIANFLSGYSCSLRRVVIGRESWLYVPARYPSRDEPNPW